MRWVLATSMALAFVLGCTHASPPVIRHSEWTPKVFEKESDNPRLWGATVDVLRQAGVTYKVVRINETPWSAQPYYIVTLEGTNGTRIKCTVGGRLEGPFSYVHIDLREKEIPQPPPGN